MAQPDIDIIAAVVQIPSHYEVVMAALHAGKHVYCEWPLGASLILGVVWAVWHAPGKFGGIDPASLSDTIVEWVLIVLVTVIFTWLINRTKGSILVTALIHPAMNTTGNFLNASIGALLLIFLFIIFVIVLDKMWRRLPVDHSAIFLEDLHDRN